MKRTTLLIAAMTMLMASPALAEEPKAAKKAGAKAAAPAMPPEMAAAMKEMQELGAPGEAHQKLKAAFVGKWDVAVKTWMGKPDPEVSKATQETRAILGGRYLQEDFSGSMMGQKFTGMSIIGYDNHKKKYFSTWMDSGSTTMWKSEGELDASGKVLTFTGTGYSPMHKKDVTSKMVMRIESNDKHVGEMFEPGPDGKEMRIMEMTYTRRK